MRKVTKLSAIDFLYFALERKKRTRRSLVYNLMVVSHRRSHTKDWSAIPGLLERKKGDEPTRGLKSTD
jgi:hypothetical protein